MNAASDLLSKNPIGSRSRSCGQGRSRPGGIYREITQQIFDCMVENWTNKEYPLREEDLLSVYRQFPRWREQLSAYEQKPEANHSSGSSEYRTVGILLDWYEVIRFTRFSNQVWSLTANP